MENVGQRHKIDFFVPDMVRRDKDAINSEFTCHDENIAVNKLIAKIANVAYLSLLS